MNSNEEVSGEISIIDLYHIIMGRLKLIILVTFLTTTLAASYAWFIATPQYRSNADVMVQIEQASGSTDPNFDYANAFRLIDTVAELMEKEVVYNVANDALLSEGFESVTHDYFQEGISISASTTSFFINVSFIDKNPEYSQAAVNAIIDAVIEVTDEEGAFPVLTNKIRRTSFATAASYDSPNRILFAIIGALLGGIISVGYVLAIELLSTSFKSKEEIEKVLNIQVIGVIPTIDVKGLKLHGNKK
jgi:capsular polysaccharide biosynthesis protein